MPVFNEAGLVESIVDRVQAVSISHELIIIDDGSTDGVGAVLDKFEEWTDVKMIRHPMNRGKGAAPEKRICKGDGADRRRARR